MYCLSLVWFEMGSFVFVLFGLVFHLLDWFGLVCLVLVGLVWFDLICLVFFALV